MVIPFAHVPIASPSLSLSLSLSLFLLLSQGSITDGNTDELIEVHSL